MKKKSIPLNYESTELTKQVLGFPVNQPNTNNSFESNILDESHKTFDNEEMYENIQHSFKYLK